MQVNEMNIPVVSNVTGNIIENKEDVVPLLTKQVMNPVKMEAERSAFWENRSRYILSKLGPARSLTADL